ncbi:hypothetical protein cyc_05461 [Cyclospora cayetanensis]|uniref:Uncharacterized protein n=1 Tax=Cyclospora cayetanensis TaxID=88456 RepID=A0A1D3DB40_9EIME|nr:hypothetical protein cyc_05461 [Cyclospora cayetanensis]
MVQGSDGSGAACSLALAAALLQLGSRNHYAALQLLLLALRHAVVLLELTGGFPEAAAALPQGIFLSLQRGKLQWPLLLSLNAVATVSLHLALLLNSQPHLQQRQQTRPSTPLVQQLQGCMRHLEELRHRLARNLQPPQPREQQAASWIPLAAASQLPEVPSAAPAATSTPGGNGEAHACASMRGCTKRLDASPDAKAVSNARLLAPGYQLRKPLGARASSGSPQEPHRAEAPEASDFRLEAPLLADPLRVQRRPLLQRCTPRAAATAAGAAVAAASERVTCFLEISDACARLMALVCSAGAVLRRRSSGSGSTPRSATRSAPEGEAIPGDPLKDALFGRHQQQHLAAKLRTKVLLLRCYVLVGRWCRPQQRPPAAAVQQLRPLLLQLLRHTVTSLVWPWGGSVGSEVCTECASNTCSSSSTPIADESGFCCTSCRDGMSGLPTVSTEGPERQPSALVVASVDADAPGCMCGFQGAFQREVLLLLQLDLQLDALTSMGASSIGSSMGVELLAQLQREATAALLHHNSTLYMQLQLRVAMQQHHQDLTRLTSASQKSTSTITETPRFQQQVSEADSPASSSAILHPDASPTKEALRFSNFSGSAWEEHTLGGGTATAKIPSTAAELMLHAAAAHAETARKVWNADEQALGLRRGSFQRKRQRDMLVASLTSVALTLQQAAAEAVARSKGEQMTAEHLRRNEAIRKRFTGLLSALHEAQLQETHPQQNAANPTGKKRGCGYTSEAVAEFSTDPPQWQQCPVRCKRRRADENEMLRGSSTAEGPQGISASTGALHELSVHQPPSIGPPRD